MPNWKSKTPQQKQLCEALEEAIHIVDNLYHPIESHGINREEDMGILQCDRRQKSEGIRVKKESYGNRICVQILCVPGPRNHDPTTNTMEFEPGAKSHKFFLAYDKLPSQETLLADIWFIGKRYNTGIPLHNPWLSLSAHAQNQLKEDFEGIPLQKLAA